MREKRFNLAWEALVTLATTGHAVALELCADLEQRLGLEPGNRAVERAFFVDLPGLGWAYKETPTVYGNLKLALLRIDQDGVSQLRGQYRIVVNEWERMNAEHNGETYARHTLGVLALAWQARRRGHQVRLLPGYAGGGRQWSEPDILIDRVVRMEVETRPRNKLDKWLKISKVAKPWGICLFTEKQKFSMWRELAKINLEKRAWLMSLEALMKEKELSVNLLGARI